jgi:hypothetical protein
MTKNGLTLAKKCIVKPFLQLQEYEIHVNPEMAKLGSKNGKFGIFFEF